MFFFLLGYIGLVLMIVLDVTLSRNLLVGVIFFCGACFVYLVMSITRTSLVDIRRRTSSLIEVNEDLEKEISERKRAEDGLKYSEQYLRSIIDTEPECVMLVERDGTVRAMNPAGLEMLEAGGAEDVIGSRIHRFLPPGHRKPFLAFMERVFQGEKESLQFKVTGFRAGERWLETHAVPFRDERLGETLMLAVTRDITERWQLEQQLQQSQKMESLGTLTGGIAHEFNNIMTAILGFGELMRDGMEENHSLRTYLDYIIISAERAARLTEGLLTFSRKRSARPEPVDINGVIAVAEGLLSRIAGETVTLECRTSGRSLPVKIDRAQMEQALVNLAANAIDAMPRGGRLTITSEYVTAQAAIREPDGEVPAGEYALITVADTGSGMD
jgi:PAS domain S-box-containing protein